MTTGEPTGDPTGAPTGAPTGSRLPLRLALSGQPGKDTLDGGWWPRSRDLSAELADLVDHFPPAFGRVVDALVSPPDWDTSPLRVPVRDGTLEVAPLPPDDTHVVVLRTSAHPVLRVLVVPPDVSDDDGHEAMLAASTTGNKHAAGDLLQTVTDSPPVDPAGFWPAATT